MDLLLFEVKCFQVSIYIQGVNDSPGILHGMAQNGMEQSHGTFRYKLQNGIFPCAFNLLFRTSCYGYVLHYGHTTYVASYACE